MLLKIIGIGILTVISALLVKELKPELSFLITLAGSLIILLTVFSTMTNVVSLFNKLVSKTNINSELFLVILKVIGIAYLTEFASNICSDVGNSSIANKIILGGKIAIILKCYPILSTLVDIIIGFIP